MYNSFDSVLVRRRLTRIWKHIDPDTKEGVLCLERMFGEYCPMCERRREIDRRAGRKLNDGPNKV